MPRWKKTATEFKVNLFKSRNHDGSESKMCTVPKPLVDLFGPCGSLRFKVADDGTVTVQGVS